MKKYLPLLIIALLSLSAWLSGVQHYFNLTQLKNHQQTLETFIHNHRIFSLLIFSGLYTFIVALSLPAATFMTIASGFFFGQWLGTAITVTSATIGAGIVFLSTKIATGNLAQRASPWVQKMQSGFQKDALSYMFTLRLIPLFPFVAVNLAAAILQIPYRIFVFGTFFGIIPGSFVYVSMGVALREIIQKPDFSSNLILKPEILLALTGLGVLSTLPVLYKKLQNKSS